MMSATNSAVEIPRVNPTLAALMAASVAVYLACCAATLLGALAGRETQRTPLLTREPREIQIGPPRAEPGPEIKHGAAVVAMISTQYAGGKRVGGVR